MKTLTVAIGDIHGMTDKMYELMTQIYEYCSVNLQYEKVKIVFLGDYVDRGPDSKGVLEHLMFVTSVPNERYSYVALMGNHEDMMLDAFDYRIAVGHNLADFDDFYNGERATLESFGVRRFSDIPPQFVEFVRNLPLYYEDELRIFVHAGINPQIEDMSLQNKNILVWTREPFVSSKMMMHKYVVHGHTPYDSINGVRAWKNKANLDTAAVFGGKLTAAFFNEDQAPPFRFIQV